MCFPPPPSCSACFIGINFCPEPTDILLSCTTFFCRADDDENMYKDMTNCMLFRLVGFSKLNRIKEQESLGMQY